MKSLGQIAREDHLLVDLLKCFWPPFRNAKLVFTLLLDLFWSATPEGHLLLLNAPLSPPTRCRLSVLFSAEQLTAGFCSFFSETA